MDDTRQYQIQQSISLPPLPLRSFTLQIIFSSKYLQKENNSPTYPCLQWEKSAKFRTFCNERQKQGTSLPWSCSIGNFAASALLEKELLEVFPGSRWGWGPTGGMCLSRWEGKKGCLGIRTGSLNTLGQIGCAWHRLFCHYLANKQGGTFSKQFNFPILYILSLNAFADWIAKASPEMDNVYQSGLGS